MTVASTPFEINGQEVAPQALAEQAILFFAVEYFPHLITHTPCQMHYELSDDLTVILHNKDTGSFNAVAAPRGFAKTTFISVIVPIFCDIYNLRSYVILISHAASVSYMNLENIKHEYQTNEMLARDFPTKVGEGPVWRQDIIVTKSGTRIDALGARMQLRGRLHHGHRPDLVVLDDLETDESVNTLAQRTKLARWMDRAVTKVGKQGTDIFAIGTILTKDSLLNQLLTRSGWTGKKYKAVLRWADNIHLWDQWAAVFHDRTKPDRESLAFDYFNANKEKMLEGTEVLWPEKWTYYTLMVEREREGPSAFASERQNEPAEEDGLVSIGDIQYYEPSSIKLEDMRIIVGGVDPSMGKRKGNYSAIVVVAQDMFGYIYVLHASIARRKPDRIIQDCVELHQRPLQPWWHRALGMDRFLVEEVQFQEFFKDCLEDYSRERYVYLPIEGVRPHSDKTLRIMSLQPIIKSGTLKFRRDGTQSTLIDQCTTFTTKSDGEDDGPDCLQMVTDYVIGMGESINAIIAPSNEFYSYGTR